MAPGTPPAARSFPSPGRRAVLCGLLVLAALASGCEKEAPKIRLADLTEAEHRYLTRLIVLERAKAAAFVERDRGEALLDSLAAAWGDSVVPETLAGMPDDATRARSIGLLFGRVMRAEHDSLLAVGGFARLHAPLPDPPPPVKRESEPEPEF